MKLKSVFTIILLLFFSKSYGQADCPPNIDFELGNTSKWEYSIGFCCPIVTPTVTPALPNRHVLTSGTAVDPYGLFPIVYPGNGAYSLKLGNDDVGSEAEKARYYIHVPAGVTSYRLIYRYAVVFQNPANHTFDEQPRFEVRAFDSITHDTIRCAQFVYVADSTIPGFHLSPSSFTGNKIYYKEWTTGFINLLGYAGSTVIIEFASGDCSLGAHFGYGYLDMSCGLFPIEKVACNKDSTFISAPGGFDNYLWYNATLTTLLGTTQTMTFPTPTTPTRYAVVLEPYAGYGCNDTFYTTLYPVDLSLETNTHTALLCSDKPFNLNATATGNASPFTYKWIPATGLSCATCSNPVASITDSTIYTVKVVDTNGCNLTDTLKLNVFKAIMPYFHDTTVCYTSTFQLNATPAGAYLPSSYVWSPPTGLSCPTCAITWVSLLNTPDKGSITYTVKADFDNGCTGLDSITVHPSLLITGATDSVLCKAGTLLLNPVATGYYPPLQYSWAPASGLSCTNCPNPVASVSTSTNYQLTITDLDGCTRTIDVAAIVDEVFPFPTIDTVVCRDYPVTVSAKVQGGNGPYTYFWVSAPGLGCNTCEASEIIPQDTTTYLVLVVDKYGCNATDTVIVNTDLCDLWFPNAFTPNGDGLNDFARVTGFLEYYTDFSLSIYNRFGERVFYTQDIHAGWDGVYNNVPQDLGTYFYVFYFTLYGKKHMQKGDVTLVR